MQVKRVSLWGHGLSGLPRLLFLEDLSVLRWINWLRCSIEPMQHITLYVPADVYICRLSPGSCLLGLCVNTGSGVFGSVIGYRGTKCSCCQHLFMSWLLQYRVSLCRYEDETCSVTLWRHASVFHYPFPPPRLPPCMTKAGMYAYLSW